MTEIPKAPINRLIKTCGEDVRINKDAETALTEAVEAYTQKLGEAVVSVAGHAGRKTVQPEDVELVLKLIAE